MTGCMSFFFLMLIVRLLIQAKTVMLCLDLEDDDVRSL